MDVVTVACKLRNGLILRTFKPHKINQPVIGGGVREVTEYLPDGQQHYINGNAAPYAQPLLDANGDAIMMEQSFALTPNVPQAFWDLWMEQNKNSNVVKNGLIFASSKPMELRAMAKANRDRKHGLEPIDVHANSGDPRNPTRALRQKMGSISGLQPANASAEEA